MSKPRVLLLTPFPPFPPDNGGVLRIHSLLTRLSGRFDFSLLTFARETGERRFRQNAALLALRGVFSEIHAVPKESTRPAPGLPEIAREWYSPEMASTLERLTRAGRADLVHIEFLQMAFYARHAVGVPTVLTEHDTGHRRFFGSYLREWSGPKRWARLGEWWRTRAYHSEACRAFDWVVALTPSDRDVLARVVGPGKVALIPTCVDLERFAFRPETAPRPADLVFVGHYPHYPNEDAALWLARKVLPRLARRRPGASLRLVGSEPTPAVRALAGPGVEVTGMVPDVRPHLDAASVYAAGVRLGRGVKGKVLEAFARGVPVVATSVVCQGIPESRRGEHLLVADSADDFARACRSLLGDPGLRSRLAAAARALAERHYDWEGSTSKLDALYRGLAASRRGEAVPA